jgi:hypothetical protein
VAQVVRLLKETEAKLTMNPFANSCYYVMVSNRTDHDHGKEEA